MPSHNFKDLSGRRFGRLVAVQFLGSLGGKSKWLCACDCGAETTKSAQHLTLGLIQSCGCLRRQNSAETLRAIATTHGLSKQPWYSVWAGMMYRCYGTNGKRFHRYGGRGIEVCERWHDPSAFHADMGDPPDGMTLDRIDNDLGYSPENCRWASVEAQNNNRCTTKMIEFNGRRMSAAQWARLLGFSKAAMYERLRALPLHEALRSRSED
jgi:hypothetical protein